ncbi:MAG: T9SS type A sorting domain-containing protein [Bacteroidaceae bacterium]|nr:T9SS type A sorting domain-containing protein [Bacteroidaceae bacterium]
MRKTYFLFLLLALAAIMPASAASSIKLGFTRTGTDAQSVTISVTDENGTAINGAAATLTSSHTFKGTGGAVTQSIICPDVNGNTSPTIKLTFTVTGVPTAFKFDNIDTHIHALNGSSNYQETGDGVVRQWNVVAKQGSSSSNLATFGSLSNIDIAAGITGANKVWTIEGSEVAATNTLVVELTITAGNTNKGCFFGLSELSLINTNEEEGGEGEEGGETDTPEDDGSKIYTISWKTTGSNYITEGTDQSMYVASYSITERQFWKFIPTGNENCYYIQNTATGNYITSCNKTPSSASRITTGTERVEYYVAPTAATSGEIAGCHYFSSTDCESYSDEAAGPRALNKDGASNYVITWQAGTGRVGSYWKLTETEDLYEVRNFEPTDAIGNIDIIYSIGTSQNNVSIYDNNISLQTKDVADTYQGWYFVGSNNQEGYLIASAKFVSTTIGIDENGAITATTANDTRWQVFAEGDGFTFRSKEGGITLEIDGESIFYVNRQRTTYALDSKIYYNPCGTLGSTYITSLKLAGEGTINALNYESTSKPSTWHKIYSHDKATVALGGESTLNITLSQAAGTNLKAFSYFDWNADGAFDTTEELTVNGTSASGTITVPDWAEQTDVRMRVRINSNGLNLADDDVEGFLYDFIVNVTPAKEGRNVTVAVNDKARGSVLLSPASESYAKGTALTATATPYKGYTFICWKESNNIVSTDATYSFTVEHDMDLVAFFSPYVEETPITGTFVRLQGKASGNYMSATPISGEQMSMIADGTAASTVFFHTSENKLLSYTAGTYMHSTHSIGTIGRANAETVEFRASQSGTEGYNTLYTNYSGSKYVYDNTTKVDRNSSYAANNCEWAVTNITELPVTIDDTGYTTIFCPIALEVPAGVTAYTAQIDGDHINLTEVPNGIIPASTAVIIKGEKGTYGFTITESSETVEDNVLLGTVEKTSTGSIPNPYTLQTDDTAENGVVMRRYTGSHINGFKMYMSISDAEAAAYSFRFPGTTGVESTKADEIGIIYGDNTVTATGKAIKSIAIYNSNAALVANSKGNTISTASLANGIYIIKVYSANGEKNFKFYNR